MIADDSIDPPASGYGIATLPAGPSDLVPPSCGLGISHLMALVEKEQVWNDRMPGLGGGIEGFFLKQREVKV